PSSGCWTTPRSTGCRPTRSTPRATSPPPGRPSARPPSASAPRSAPPSSRAGDEPAGSALTLGARRPGAGASLLLRPGRNQGAGLDTRDPLVLLHRRARRRLGGARLPRRAAGIGAARPPRLDDRARRTRREPGAPDLRPRPARAVPEHAADVQVDLADERRLVAARRQRRRDRA